MDENVRVYDFKKPQRYSSDNMRFLSVVSEEFCKNVNLFLAYELKKQKIHCKIEKVEQTNYDEFINIIDKDSVIVEHAIQPLVQDLIYQIDKNIALTLIDVVLGGSGWTPEARSHICVCRASFLMTFFQSGMPPRLPAQEKGHEPIFHSSCEGKLGIALE